MLKVNEYFNGNVKSIAFSTPKGPATLGVMSPGTYEFGTTTEEIMTVVSGKLTVQFPGQKRWKTFLPFESFTIPKNKKFCLKIEEDSGYLCLYR
jgi:purine/pyrimidine-nucleoside phosphorylase